MDAAHFVFAPFWVACGARAAVRAGGLGWQAVHVVGALDAVTHRLVRVTDHDYMNAESVCALSPVAAASVGLPIRSCWTTRGTEVRRGEGWYLYGDRT